VIDPQPIYRRFLAIRLFAGSGPRPHGDHDEHPPHRDTIMRLGVRVGEGCAALHDEMMRFVQVNRLELDELWSYVGKRQRKVKPGDPADLGDQYVFIGIDATRKAIIS
jgi:hypothetical protein